MVWEDELNDEEIAHACRICRRTLGYWKDQEAFQRMVMVERLAWLEANERWPSDSRSITELRERLGITPPPPPETKGEAEGRIFIHEHFGPGREFPPISPDYRRTR